MTGRARGRSRGRGRAEEYAGPGETAERRPGMQAQQAAASGEVGRGRSRGAAPPQDSVAPRPGAQPPQQDQDLSSQMDKMRVAESGEGNQRDQGPRRRALGTAETPRVIISPGVDKTGSTGSRVPLVANVFKLIDKPGWKLFQYVAAFDPEIQSTRLRHALIYDVKDELFHGPIVTDTMTLFSRNKLPDQVTKKDVTTNQGNDIMITFTYTNEVPLNSPSVIQLCNIIFRRCLKDINMELIGRDYYNTSRAIEVPAHKLEVWPGFSCSILQYESDVLLMADVRHKILRKQSVLEFLYELYGSVNRDTFHEVAAKKIVGETVITRYNNKTYRVDGIEWDTHPTDTFEKKDGSRMTFTEYYLTSYNKNIQDNDQPMLVSIPKDKERRRGIEKILLVPELCSITNLTDDMRANFSVMKDVAQHTRVSPADRAQNLERFMHEIKSNPEVRQKLQEWDLDFDANLLRMEGRVLPPEKISMKDKQFFYDQRTADFSSDTRGAAVISAIALSKWLVVHGQRDAPIVNDFVSTLKRVGGPIGMQISEPTRCQVENDQTQSFLNTIKETITDLSQMVVVIVPDNRKERYDAIKKLCAVEHPVPCQIVVSRTLSKKQMLMFVATKIALQMNCKMGGELWAVEIPVSNIMVIGTDVYHDSLTEGVSALGFVATTNDRLTRYYSRCSFHSSHQEIADALKVHVTGALRKYSAVNGVLPDRIVVYRHGVGDGQLSQVIEHEIPRIKEAAKDVDAGYEPKLGVIVVNTQVTSRIFEANGGFANPRPGTIVDSVITRREWYDFFLVSSTVRQGTASPTHYNVIHDTTGLQADHIHRLTYKLTHLYYNWTQTVDVPAPCKYAHKLAFLIGQSIHTQPSTQLSDSLYYL